MQAISFSFLVGMLAVIQAGLNRQISAKLNLPTAILINSIVFLVIALIYWFYAGKETLTTLKFEWWYIFPGVCGALLVFGIPWAIPQIGALKVFLFIVAGQMLMSLAWDFFIEKKIIDIFSVVGALVVFTGLIISNWQKV